MSLNSEYKTLRAELLQLYSEQSTLTFVSGITSAAVLFGLLQTETQQVIGVFVWHLILIGIAWKLFSNYRRIYRIAGYLKIVHELKAKITYTPAPDEPAWHYRTRSIGRRSAASWKWGSGARVDALFLRVLGFVGTLFPIASALSVWPPKSTDLVGVTFTIATFVFLLTQTQRLFRLRDESDRFEQSLWELLAEEAKTNQKPQSSSQ